MGTGRKVSPDFIKLSGILCLLLIGLCSNALPEDSARVKKPSTMNDTWFLTSQPEQRNVIDSSIYHLEDYNLVEREGIEYVNTGNTGGAAFPTVFDMKRGLDFNVGYNQFDVYRFQKDSIKHYQVIRPYVEIEMMIGLHNEELFNGKFANQHKGIIYYGVEFNRIFSKGAYTNQQTNDNGFDLYGIFNSKNKHWNIEADLIFNSFKVGENGGVTDDPFDGNYFQKSLVPVQTSATNDYNEINFYLTSAYNVGKKYFVRQHIDSARKQSLMPVFKVSHQFNISRNTYKYRDFAPDSLYYLNFYTPDSVYNDLSYLKVGNAIQLEYHPRKLTSDSTYEEKDFVAFAEAGFDYFWLKQDTIKDQFGNLYVGGTFRNNFASKQKILYKASAKYYLSGYNQNDLLIDGLAGYDFGKLGMLTGNAAYKLEQAPYIFERYAFERGGWDYHLPKTKTLNIGGKYQNLKYGIVADVNYYVVDHIPVYPGLSNPYITNGEENVIVAHLGNRNSIAGVHFDNDIWYSAAPNLGYINYNFPAFYSKHSLYYSRRLFHNLFWFAIGFDLRLRYANNAPYYDPLFGAFYPEGPITVNSPYFAPIVISSYPVLDFFVNFKIKTVRIFLKVDNISSEFGPVGYTTLFRYPAPDITFQAGVKWRFFE